MLNVRPAGKICPSSVRTEEGTEGPQWPVREKGEVKALRHTQQTHTAEGKRNVRGCDITSGGMKRGTTGMLPGSPCSTRFIGSYRGRIVKSNSTVNHVHGQQWDSQFIYLS